MHADLVKGRPQAVKASQMWLSSGHKCQGCMMAAQVWLTNELVHGEVYSNAFTGSNSDALIQGPQ